jgi:hypothetical protein
MVLQVEQAKEHLARYLCKNDVALRAIEDVDLVQAFSLLTVKPQDAVH